jgi:hypothetical protein
VSSLETSLNDTTAYLGHILTDIGMCACHIFSSICCLQYYFNETFYFFLMVKMFLKFPEKIILIPVLRISECDTVAAHNSALEG